MKQIVPKTKEREERKKGGGERGEGMGYNTEEEINNWTDRCMYNVEDAY